jgi:protein-disulfide isomerase
MRRLLHSFIHALKALRFTTPVAVIVGSLIIGGSILGYGFIMQSGSSGNATMFTGKAIDPKTDMIEGNLKSKVTIVEYSDPECPFCVTVYPTMKQLRNDYRDKASFVYRHFPLTQIHPHAFDESKAIACAQSVGGSVKALEYMDALYGYKSAKQTTELVATGKEDLAKNIGLDITTFTACMNNQAVTDAVTASMNDGVAAGVQGTPSSFILVKTRKGYEVVAMIDGARPLTYFKAAIDEALAR